MSKAKENTKLSSNFDLTKFYCFHLTPIMPANGVIRAGGIVNFHEKLVENILPNFLRRSSSEITELIPRPLPLRQYLEQIMQQAPTTRITLHWTLNHTVIPHGESSDYSKYEYLIIEPIKALKNVFGGLVDDIIQVGDHELSSEAIVIIPSVKKSAFKLANPNFAGKIETYDNDKINVRQACQEILRQLELEEIITEADKELNNYRSQIKDFDFLYKKVSELKYLHKHYQGKDLKRAIIQEGIDIETISRIMELPQINLSSENVFSGAKKFNQKELMNNLFGNNIFIGLHSETSFMSIEQITSEAFKVLNILAAINLIPELKDENIKPIIKKVVLRSCTKVLENVSKFVSEIQSNFVQLKAYIKDQGETGASILKIVNEFELYMNSWLKVISQGEAIYNDDALLKAEASKAI